MILYKERQLEEAYKVYQRHQIQQDLSFMSLENFRFLFEELQLTIVEELFNDEIQYD